MQYCAKRSCFYFCIGTLQQVLEYLYTLRFGTPQSLHHTLMYIKLQGHAQIKIVHHCILLINLI